MHEFEQVGDEEASFDCEEGDGECGDEPCGEATVAEVEGEEDGGHEHGDGDGEAVGGFHGR